MVARLDNIRRMSPKSPKQLHLTPVTDIGRHTSYVNHCLPTIIGKNTIRSIGRYSLSRERQRISAITSCINDTELRQLQHQRSNRLNVEKDLSGFRDFYGL